MPRISQKPAPPIGQICKHNYKGVLFTMVVVETKEGKIGYKVGNVTYSSPTAAAKAVVGKDQFINGRIFWHLD